MAFNRVFAYVYVLLICILKLGKGSITSTIATNRTRTETTTPTSPTCPTPTPGKPECPPSMYLVEDDRCLQLFQWDRFSSPDKQCQKCNGTTSSGNTIARLSRCYTSDIKETRILTSVDSFIDTKDWSQGQRQEDGGLFDIACLFEATSLVSPELKKFYIQIWNQTSWNTIILERNSEHRVTVNRDIRDFNLVCLVDGVPRPQVKILHSDMANNERSQPVATVDVGCQRSITYTCMYNNSLGSGQISATLTVAYLTDIQKFVINKLPLDRTAQIMKGNSAIISCETSGCPSPDKQLYLSNEQEEQLTASQSNNSITYTLGNISCSDMGRYYCRVRDEMGKIHERSTELTVRSCPIQLCSNERQNKTLTATVNQTVYMSVCVISAVTPFQQSSDSSNKMSVHYLKQGKSQIYYKAIITITNLLDNEIRVKFINLTNPYGRLEYSFTLLTLEPFSQERARTLESGFHLAYVLPCGLLVIVFIFGGVIHVIKKRHCHSPRSINAYDMVENDKLASSHYEEIQDVQIKIHRAGDHCTTKQEKVVANMSNNVCQYANANNTTRKLSNVSTDSKDSSISTVNAANIVEYETPVSAL